MPKKINGKRGPRTKVKNRRGASVRAVPKVALLIETSNAYARGLLRGVVAHMREHHSWSIYLSEHMRGDRPPAWLVDWDGDGVIARIENQAIAKAVERLGAPTVDVSAARLIPTLPWVETNDAAIARLAADHLTTTCCAIFPNPQCPA
jgi:LacI family transcriptional regulator